MIKTIKKALRPINKDEMLQFRGTTLIAGSKNLPLQTLTQQTEFPTFISETQLTGYFQRHHIRFFQQTNLSLKCEGIFYSS